MEQGFQRYQITINHRGPDVKKTLASLIYRNLRKYGLSVFLDGEELQTGDSLAPAIERAIKSASLHICIFSKTYAESAWCLNELVWILACQNAKVIPIFYGIQPSDLRYTESGAYAQAFLNHRTRKRVDTQQLEIWENALNKVSHISGPVFSEEKDDLGELMDRIEDTVLREVGREALDVARYPVGVHQAAQLFQDEVFKKTESSDTKVVGIVGPAGSGKSTLAKYLYNSKRIEFSRSCFLSDVNKRDLPSLQQNLLTELVGYQAYLHIDDTSQGKSKIRHRLAGYRVFIVFDGVDDTDQMENLLFPVKDVIASGSLIIVTSHDRRLLYCSQIETVYDVKLLNARDSRELFCLHAFQRSRPLEGFQDLVQQLVEDFHKEIPERILENVLRQSYDSLQSKEKEAFLDVAHFLVGEDNNLAIRVLDGLGYSGKDCLEALHHKCLLEFQRLNVDFNVNVQDQYIMPLGDPTPKFTKPLDFEGFKLSMGRFKITMHDLIRGLAKQIAREQPFIRFCCSNDQTLPIQLQSKPYSFRGIYSGENGESLQLPAVLLGQEISGLNVLVLRCPLDINYFSGDLIWLRLTNCNFSCIPSSLSLRGLRVLELSDINLKDLSILCDAGEEPSQPFNRKCTLFKLFNPRPSFHRRRSYEALPSTSSFDIASAQVSLLDSSVPESICQMWIRKLRKTYAKMVSKRIKFLPTLPINFSEIKRLTHLDLSGCSNLEELPNSFTQLSQLQYLSLRNCKKLVLRDLGEILTLEYLDLEGCILLSELPRGTTHQRSLRYLNVLNTTLEQLPDRLENLENLEQLFMGSLMLQRLPSSFNGLGQLKELILFECFKLSDIGDFIEQLVHLERLKIFLCSGVRMLPEGIAWRKIKHLDVQWCLMFEGFQVEMDSGRTPSERFLIRSADCVGKLASTASYQNNNVCCLTNLIIRDSRIAKVYIPQAKSLCPNLEFVDLSNNLYLTNIEGLPDNLIRLNLMDCRALKTLACISNLSHLKFLDISGCDGLESLNVEGIISIEEIKADKCWRLRRIQGLALLKKLSHFQISTFNTVSCSTWRDILSFPSSVSTAILCGASVSMEDVGEMEEFAHNCQDITVKGISLDVLERGIPISVKFVYADLEGIILMCIVAHKYCKFEVTIDNHSYKSSCIMDDMNTSLVVDDGNSNAMHVMMWTRDSQVFKDFKFTMDETVFLKIKLLNPFLPKRTRLNKTVAALKQGWIVKAKSLELCKQFVSYNVRRNSFQ